MVTKTLIFAEWVERLPKYCREEAVARTKREGFAVFIERRNDIGPWLFAVIDADKGGAEDFWMEAFSTHEEAQDFTRGVGWHYPANRDDQLSGTEE